MNGPIEETRKVATSVVDALRVQPLVLALLVLTLIFMYFIWSGVHTQRAQTAEIIKLLIDKCGPEHQSRSDMPAVPL